MLLIKELFKRNRLLIISGIFYVLLSIVLIVFSFFYNKEILGLSPMIKPLKFAVSTFVYSFTLAYLLFYINNQKKVKQFSILSVFVMTFENGVITIQAFRGKLSHFNQNELVGGILYALMGILIVWLTTATLVITIRFFLQKVYTISKPYVLSIKLGLLFFVIFSYWGGYMSVVNSHTVGGKMGSDGLPFLNWSNVFGDLRVSHFFGIHSLQVIPLVGFFIANKMRNPQTATKFIWLFVIIYISFVVFSAIQALNSQPFFGF